MTAVTLVKSGGRLEEFDLDRLHAMQPGFV